VCGARAGRLGNWVSGELGFSFLFFFFFFPLIRGGAGTRFF
jgi:hypothetical protein